MSRKDYRLIAECIRDQRREDARLDDQYILDRLVERLSDALKIDNPRFDQHKFEEACRG